MPVTDSGASVPDWVSAAIAIGALIVAVFAFFHSRAAARTQVFLEFRKRFIEIKAALPDWYTDVDMAKWPAYDPSASSGWRPIERYWQNAFDEWFITTVVDRRVLGRLWWLFYRDAIRSGLQHKALRLAASRLTHGNLEFGGYRDGFRRVLDELWRDADVQRNRTICDDFQCCVPCNTTQALPVGGRQFPRSSLLTIRKFLARLGSRRRRRVAAGAGGQSR